MDEQRRMLDELMGKSRNEDPDKNRGRNFWDSDVDKFYLAGFSPFQDFRNTKSAMWLPDCYRAAFPDRPKIGPADWDQWSRNEELKAQWNALSRKEKEKYGYEYDLMQLLERLVQKCDHRVRAVQEDIKVQNDQIMKSMSQNDEIALGAVNKDLEELDIKVKEAEALAEQGGNFESLQALMQQIDTSQKEKVEILKRIDMWRADNQRSVCEISGNVVLPPGAKRQNIHDHAGGKQYQGWKTIRELLSDFRARDLQPPRSRSKRSQSRERTRSRERDHRSANDRGGGDRLKRRGDRSRSASSPSRELERRRERGEDRPKKQQHRRR